MTTLRDVARRAGVSKSTVSNVISGAAAVAPGTRERVERAILELGYHPNAIARSLKARASLTLGVVVPDAVNPFFGVLAQATERAAHALGYAVLVANTEGSPSIEREAVRALIARRVDGVVIAGLCSGSDAHHDLLARDVPVVLVGLGSDDDPRVGVVDVDDEAAMGEVADHLADLGHERVAFLGSRLAERSGERRALAFAAHAERRGLALVGTDEGPTAIAAHDDLTAIDLIDRLERDGLRVPGDVSVVGFDDVPLAAHARIRLTTVRSDVAALGRCATERLVAAAAEGRHVAHRELHPASLVVRATTATPGGAR